MINEEHLSIISQLISGMEDDVVKLEESYKKEDLWMFESAKKEILDFQKRLDEELKNE